MTPSYLHYVRVRNELIHREVRCNEMIARISDVFVKSIVSHASQSGTFRLVPCSYASIAERVRFLAGGLGFSMARRTSCCTPDGFISLGEEYIVCIDNFHFERIYFIKVVTFKLFVLVFFPVANHTLCFVLYVDGFDSVVCSM